MGQRRRHQADPGGGKAVEPVIPGPIPAVIPGWSEGPDPESRDSGFIAARCPGMTTTPSLQRLVDFDLEHGVDIGRRHRADHLVDDGALAADDEGLRHAVNPPFDPGAAVAVDTDDSVRVAVTAEKASGLFGSILVI